MTETEPRAPTPRRLRSRLLSSLPAVSMVLILALPLSVTSAAAQMPQQENSEGRDQGVSLHKSSQLPLESQLHEDA